ncbi:MAG TPA: hypothetical protein VH988_23795 [Thermoanaerobaculia bacterium]|jgi:hypothetical protein|nr:hypothetical protein [Thermoanaerobaculia bacterium]
MKRALVGLAVAAVLLTALPLAAQTGTWTAVASTGVVDESAVGIYAFGTTDLGYLAGSPSVAPIVARYNVTNTLGGGVSDMPPWTILELGSINPSVSSSVTATLFQVDPCTGAQVPLCTVTSGLSTTGVCKTCQFAPNINFASKLYYVQVTIARSSAGLQPRALTLRIH